MSLVQRKYFYAETMVNGNKELDFIKTPINEMDLSRVGTYLVTAPTEGRPDLISNVVFGNYDFGWLLSLYNEILDPFTEYYIGREILIPSLDDYYRFYNRYARRVT